jgi:hypothetical protein
MDNRVRKVDIDKLTPEQADNISEQIGEKLREMIDDTVSKANRMLNIYGFNCKMQFLIEPIQQPKQEDRE